MKFIQIIFLFLLINFPSFAQKLKKDPINDYLSQIRHNKAILRAFFQQMPKGGDLHHHYSGSVYTETYLETIELANFWVNIKTYDIAQDAPFLRNQQSWFRISSLIKNGTWAFIKEELTKKWSIKNYTTCNHLPPDQHFFSTFVHFMIPSTMRYIEGLQELKRGAKNEKLQYIETMLTNISYKEEKKPLLDYNPILRELQSDRNTAILDTLTSLSRFYLLDPNFESTISSFNHFVDSIHQGIDDEDFTMRYQNYILRVLPPVEVFKNLLISFASANKSKWIVGVNIVAPENNEISMRDYWLHMQMFQFCHQLFPNVPYAMHAGELTVGLVQPEDLSWHVDAAVNIAGAKRIGHGVGIIYESNKKATLEYMKKHQIAVEVSLTSNEFILGIKGYEHPITYYQKHGVPIVISTDDAGVLRTDLTQQYVLLANRYTEIDYQAIKKMVYNSLELAFLEEEKKKVLLKQLTQDFEQFEKMILLEIGQSE